MRRTPVLFTLALAAFLASAASAKFGMSKTTVMLPRVKPPQFALLGQTVTVEVTTRARSVLDSHLDRIRQRIEEGLKTGDLRLVDSAADNTIRISIETMDAKVDTSIAYERKYVQTGTRQEWNANRKKYETKPVYGYRQEPVKVSKIAGKLIGRAEIRTPAAEESSALQATYQAEFKDNDKVPAEVASESSLEDYLVEDAALKAASLVAPTPDPVEAMLAVDGELKDGNKLAEAGRWREALDAWTVRKFKGDKEAARLHNVGVAHEALAYSFPSSSADHKIELDQASEHYRQASALDPGEKHFRPPIDRVDASIAQAETAQRQTAEATRWREEAARRQAEATRPARTERVAARAPEATPATVPRRTRRATAPATTATPVPASATAPPVPAAPPVKAAAPVTGLGSSATLAIPLRNGTFESAIAPWTVAGNVLVSTDAERGKVLAMTASTGPASAAQALSLEMGTGALLALEYKVVTPGRVRAIVVYEDAQGRPATKQLDVTAGGAARSWEPWTADLTALRPAPVRIKEVKIAIEGGAVLIDNVALTPR